MVWFQKKAAEPGAARQRGGGEAVHELLDESVVLFPPPGLDKAGVLDALAAAACKAHGLGEPGPYLARVREREEGISTTLDSGLSLPHARVDGIDHIVAALAVIPHGIADAKQPGVPIKAMFLFFSPNKQEAFTKHLHLLRAVSTLFKPELIVQIGAMRKPGDVLAALRSAN